MRWCPWCGGSRRMVTVRGEVRCSHCRNVVADEPRLGVASVSPSLVLHPRTLARLRAAEAEVRALVRPEVADGFDREIERFVLGDGSGCE